MDTAVRTRTALLIHPTEELRNYAVVTSYFVVLYCNKNQYLYDTFMKIRPYSCWSNAMFLVVCNLNFTSSFCL